MSEETKGRIDEIASKYEIVSWELVSSYEEGYIGKKSYIVTYADGTKRKVDQITKNKGNGDAVIIVPVTVDNKFVMIVESRPNALANVAVEFPAGMVDGEENPEDAARRELLEETGYSCENIIEMENHHQDQGCSQAIIRVYLATGCKKIQDLHTDEDERLDYLEMSYDEVLELLEQSDVKKVGINDSGSKIAFLTYALRYKK